MFSNYLKIAIRNLFKHKGYSFINVFGLTLGMACCILIMLYVQDELSYDRYHTKANRIYRVSRQWMNQDGGISLHLGHIAPPFGPLLRNDFPASVLEVARFLRPGTSLVSYGDHHFQESRFFFADSAVFSIFSWELTGGDPMTALAGPNSVVISESTAKKYFGGEDAMGKVLRLNQQADLKVTGVMKDVPRNSHFQADFLCSFISFENAVGAQNLVRNWGSNNFATYILVPETFDPTAFVAQLPAFLDKHMGAAPNGNLPSAGTQLNLWPLTSIHLFSHLDSEVEPNSDVTYIYVYSAVALFVLLIACFNFMNLSTAHASRRAKEVGIRKVLGAYKQLLVRQFLGESILLSFIALVFALGVVHLTLPWFNVFVEKALAVNYAGNWLGLFALGSIAVIVGVIAGAYPAFFLSAFQPASVLKGETARGKAGLRFRSVLVVSQFAISITLIVSMGIVYDQLEFLRKKNLGFDKEMVVFLPARGQIREQFVALRDQLLSQPGITDVTISSRVPSGRLLDSQGGTAEVRGEMQQITTRIADIHVDHNFMKTYRVPFAAGRDFDVKLASDSTEAFVLNEASIAGIGWPSAEEAIGKRFQYGGRTGKVIGVVRDFHFESLHQKIAPIVFLINPGRFNVVSVRIAAGHAERVLSILKDRWQLLRPNYPFIPQFVGDQFNRQYESEERLGQVFGIFSGLAVVIACLGLLGLASFVAERRTKEIGVRKVLGASAGNIVFQLTKQFALLVLIANLVAWPLAYSIMTWWLNGFAYKTSIGLMTFFLAGVLALLVAFLTISFQAIRAAMTNPVKALRYE
ncbi:MAG TPA: ABC transporter permease [Bacteroidota bacterium]|nr:ABC transporter permease [Bacteroidota bacterium]